MISVINFIDALRKTDSYIEVIYTRGSCYKFHLLLKEMWPNATPLISHENDHIITEIDGKHYDINGEADDAGYYPLSDEQLEMVERWGFSKHMIMSFGECPECGEPLLFTGED